LENRYKILLIEDDEEDYLIFRDLLSEIKDIKFELTWITEYNEGIKIILQNRHDIYFIDYHLGERNGLELLNEATSNNADGPFIFLTGQGNREVDLAAMKAGASDYLIKSEITIYSLERSIRYTIEKHKLLEKISTMSLIDELTGLYNRKGFISLAEQQCKFTKRFKYELSLLFADLDNMKWINDTLGHKEGDKALIAIADILKDCFRESDIIARFGGDEFVVLIVESSKKASNILEQRLQEKIIAYNQHGTLSYNLSLSTGLAHNNPGQYCSIDELLKIADQLMYEQKKSKKRKINK